MQHLFQDVDHSVVLLTGTSLNLLEDTENLGNRKSVLNKTSANQILGIWAHVFLYFKVCNVQMKNFVQFYNKLKDL